MTPRFLAYIPLLISLETDVDRNGLVLTEHDPDDPGGTTKFGIDQRSHPGVDIAGLSEADAQAIYFAEWTRIQTEALPARLGELLFDIHVNGGPGIVWLQTALGVTADGFLGPRTLGAAGALDAWKVRQMVNTICGWRAARFNRLADNNAGLAKFRQGWLNRNSQVQTFCLAQMDPDDRTA